MKSEQEFINHHLPIIKHKMAMNKIYLLLQQQRENCLESIMNTDFYRKHKDDFPKSYILTAPLPEEYKEMEKSSPSPTDESALKDEVEAIFPYNPIDGYVRSGFTHDQVTNFERAAYIRGRQFNIQHSSQISGEYIAEAAKSNGENYIYAHDRQIYIQGFKDGAECLLNQSAENVDLTGRRKTIEQKDGEIEALKAEVAQLKEMLKKEYRRD